MATQNRQNSSKMLFRFSLYGFLKNQRYFDPFLILFFRRGGMGITAVVLVFCKANNSSQTSGKNV